MYLKEKAEMTDLESWIDDLEQTTPHPELHNFGRISDLVEDMANLDTQIASLEMELKEKKKERHRIEWELLPEAMDDADVTEFMTKNGSQISVKDYIHCGLAKMDSHQRTQMYAWLIDNGHGEIIKSNLQYTIGRGDYEKAQQIQEAVERHFGTKGSLEQSVHTRTLDKWAREMRESGKSFPEDVFNLTVGRRASVKVKK